MKQKTIEKQIKQEEQIKQEKHNQQYFARKRIDFEIEKKIANHEYSTELGCVCGKGCKGVCICL